MNPWLYFISTTTHILAAIIWVGGMLFMSLMLVPALRQMGNPGLTARMIQSVGRRFRWIGWGCLLVLIITGFLNLHARGISWPVLTSPDFWSSSFGKILAWKLWLFGGIVLLSVVHDGVIGPKYRALVQSPVPAARADGYRKAASWMGRLTLALSVVVVILAVMLVRGLPW